MLKEKAKYIYDLILARDEPSLRQKMINRRFNIYYEMLLQDVPKNLSLELCHLTEQDLLDVKISNIDGRTKCPHCNGNGKGWILRFLKCYYCNGTGRVWNWQVNAYYDF